MFSTDSRDGEQACLGQPEGGHKCSLVLNRSVLFKAMAIFSNQ